MSRQMPHTQGCIAIFKAVHEEKKEQRLLHWHYCCRWIFANSYSCIWLQRSATRQVCYYRKWSITREMYLYSFFFLESLRIKKPPHNVSARGAKLRLYRNDLQGCTGRYKEQLPHCRTSLRKTWYSIRYKYYWSGPKLAMWAETWKHSHSGIAVT